jgi:hypothetical protein
MIYHMYLNVRGALLWPKSKLKGMLVDKTTGRYLTPDEARNALMDELSKGHEVIPIGECDNFDFKRGCLGHENVKFNPEAV